MTIWKSRYRHLGFDIGIDIGTEIGIRMQILSFTQYMPPLELKVTSKYFLKS